MRVRKADRMKYTITLTQNKDGSFNTQRELLIEEDASTLFVVLAQRLEAAILQALDSVSICKGEGTGETSDEAQTKMRIDRDIRKAGETDDSI